MKALGWKKLAGAGAAALLFAALPFTLNASRSGVDAGIAEVCADGGACCPEIGSICGGRGHYGYCPPGGGDG